MRPRGNQVSRGSVLLAMAVIIAALAIYLFSRTPRNDIPDFADVPTDIVMPFGDGKPDVNIGASGNGNISSQADKEGIGPQLSPQKEALHNKLTNELKQTLDY